MVVISTAGAKKGDWPSYEDTLNRMSPFEFIDTKRFEKDVCNNDIKMPIDNCNPYGYSLP